MKLNSKAADLSTNEKPYEKPREITRNGTRAPLKGGLRRHASNNIECAPRQHKLYMPPQQDNQHDIVDLYREADTEYLGQWQTLPLHLSDACVLKIWHLFIIEVLCSPAA